MCLTVIMGDLGAAHAGLDMQRLVMVLSPKLDITERVIAARRMLARAGQEQPAFPIAAVCLCGVILDLTLPVSSFPSQDRDRSVAVSLWLKGARKEEDGRELELAGADNTGGFPAVRIELGPLPAGRPA